MRSWTCLRIGAGLAALYAAGHAAGMPWTPAHGALAQGVVVHMRTVQFSAAGPMRSYWDFYQGFGLALSGLLGVEAVLLWQLAQVARDGGPWRAMALTHLTGFLFLAAVAGGYIFALPLWLSLAVAACLAVALLRPRGRDVLPGAPSA